MKHIVVTLLLLFTLSGCLTTQAVGTFVVSELTGTTKVTKSVLEPVVVKKVNKVVDDGIQSTGEIVFGGLLLLGVIRLILR